MVPKHKIKSVVDSIIIDLILDYFNMQSLSGKQEMLTGQDFQVICENAKDIYYEQIMIAEKPGVA